MTLKQLQDTLVFERLELVYEHVTLLQRKVKHKLQYNLYSENIEG